MAKRTPGPWGQADSRRGIVLCPDNEWLADCEFRDADGEDEANAAFVVKSVNCHDELVQALEEAERFMAYFSGETAGVFIGPGMPSRCLDNIRAAIAKAKQEPS
jgi:hypothetical protein